MSHTRQYAGPLGWAAWSLLTAVAFVNCKPRGIPPAPSATAEDLLREAATARSNRELVRARRLESQAISGLEARGRSKLKTTLATWIGELKGANWSHDNRRLVAWSSGLASVFDAASGHELIRVQAPKGQIYLDGGLSPDAHWLVLSSDDENLSGAQFELHDVESKVAPRRFAGAIAWPGSSWVFSKEGSLIFWLESSGPESPKLVLHAADVATFTSRLALELPSVKLYDSSRDADQELTLSADGQLIVAHRSDRNSEVDRISIVEIASGRAYHFDAVHDGSTATFSASSEKAAWAAPTGIALWDRGANAPRLLHDRRCKRDEHGRALFSPSEHLLATGSYGGVCLWDVAKRRLIAMFPPNAAEVVDIPSNPRTWVHGDRGLILDNETYTELWDVLHRRKVLSYLLASSVPGGSPITLEQSSQDDLWVTEITPNLAPKRTALPQCALKDFCQTGNPDLSAFGQKVVVPCQHNPALVNLANGSTRRLQISGWESLDLSNDGAVLASRTRFGLRLYDADSGEQRTPLLSDDEYEATTSSLTLTAGDLQIDQRDPAGHIHRRLVVFGAERLSLSQSEIAPAPCAGTTPSNGNILNSSLAWKESKKLGGIVLCDFASGREAGHLRLEAGGQLVGVNADGTKVVVLTDDSTLLWHPTESKAVALSIPGGADWTFDGSYLVATTPLISAEQITVFDAATGETRMSWQIPIPKADRRLLAFNATSRLVLISSDRTTAPWSARHGIAELRRLDDGTLVGETPCELQSSAAFSSNGLLAINAGNHVSILRVPSLERVGEILMDGKAAAFIRQGGAFETTDPPERWRSRLRCEVGDVALPFDACVDALYRPGVAREIMGGPGWRSGSVLGRAQPHPSGR